MKTRHLQDYIALVIIGAYLIAAMLISTDYGVNWDDPLQRDIGKLNWNYITHADQQGLPASIDKYHGPAFELILIAAEKATGVKDKFDIYTLRHQLVIVFFALTLLIFYLLCSRLFRNKWLGLAGILILVLSPRVFAESCYNPKDIVFLGAMVMAFYSLLVFLENCNYKNALLLAVSCAFAIDVRIIGGLMIPVIFISLLIYIRQGRLSWQVVRMKLGLLSALFIIFMLMMWPILISSPIQHLIAACTQFSNYLPWLGVNRYMGTWYIADHTPWHYHFVWIAITTPEPYLILFIVGLIIFSVTAIHRSSRDNNLHIFIWFSLFIILFPLCFRAIRHSVVLDGWRHMYFVFPFMILIVLYGLYELEAHAGRAVKRIAFFILLAGFATSLVTMISMHPFQYLYFNTATRYIFRPVDRYFEMDYWGISYRQGLEYILAKDHSDKPIKVGFYNVPGYFNLDCLPAAERARFIAVDNLKDADYFLSNYRMYRAYDSLTPIHIISPQGSKMLGIYQLH